MNIVLLNESWMQQGVLSYEERLAQAWDKLCLEKGKPRAPLIRLNFSSVVCSIWRLN